ncbi:MAG: hypothetical protein M1818_001770 [Claussenomyces sp. TS43310]|nr:MAG: hypothetical protein M1818_001770 [Claussenomyces sp. TS43310]
MEICVRVVYERLVFVTSGGRLGLGPSVVKEGDQIAILHGSTTPVILRQAINNPGETPIYGVMGDCYLEDVMFGEAVDWKEDECDWFTLA